MNGNGKGNVRFKAFLFVGAACIPILIEKVGAVLISNKWPTPQLWVLAGICMSGTGFITLRAFYDGTSQRHEDKEDKIHTDETRFLTRQQTNEKTTNPTSTNPP